MKIQVNKKAITFKLQSTSGKVFNLSDVENGLVIYFYPKDNTPGCTLETKDFSLFYKKFKSLNKIDPSILLNLNKFINSIKYNVGVRQQPKLNRDLALYAATCNADHKDLSIHF